MNDEEKILKRLGTSNHFTVPDGYFENLTSQVMDKLSDVRREPVKMKMPTKWDKIKPWVYMAAMFIGAAFIIRIASWKNAPVDDDISVITQVDAENISDEFIDEMLDMSMIDDYSLYVYLTDASREY
ncbi:hypothetical protein EZS27_037801 [termite gut metagenome]|uniref:Uncharacterized protein n=1 Tax=termite gut metagenome TaxID=433724 RepID=A0A5J4PP63_9ZZZZ